MKKWIIVCGIYLSFTLLDGALTYLNTPDLTWEGNPLVSVFGFGWGALIIANVICFFLYCRVTYYSFVKYKTVIPEVKNKREYISQIFYNRPDKFVWFFYKLPKNWKPFWALFGYAAGYSFLFTRAVPVMEWSSITFGFQMSFYVKLRNLIPFGRLDLAVCLLSLSFFIAAWFYKEFQSLCLYKPQITKSAVQD